MHLNERYLVATTHREVQPLSRVESLLSAQIKNSHDNLALGSSLTRLLSKF